MVAKEVESYFADCDHSGVSDGHFANDLVTFIIYPCGIVRVNADRAKDGIMGCSEVACGPARFDIRSYGYNRRYAGISRATQHLVEISRIFKPVNMGMGVNQKRLFGHGAILYQDNVSTTFMKIIQTSFASVTSFII